MKKLISITLIVLSTITTFASGINYEEMYKKKLSWHLEYARDAKIKWEDIQGVDIEYRILPGSGTLKPTKSVKEMTFTEKARRYLRKVNIGTIKDRGALAYDKFLRYASDQMNHKEHISKNRRFYNLLMNNVLGDFLIKRDPYNLKYTTYDESVLRATKYPDYLKIWNGGREDSTITSLPMIDEESKVYNPNAVFIYVYDFEKLRKHNPQWYAHDRAAFGVSEEPKILLQYKVKMEELDQTEKILRAKSGPLKDYKDEYYNKKLNSYKIKKLSQEIKDLEKRAQKLDLYHMDDRVKQVKEQIVEVKRLQGNLLHRLTIKEEWARIKKERAELAKLDLLNKAPVTFPKVCDVNDTNLMVYRGLLERYMLRSFSNIVRDTHPAPFYTRDYIIRSPKIKASSKPKQDLINKYANMTDGVYANARMFCNDVAAMNIYDYWKGCEVSVKSDGLMYKNAVANFAKSYYDDKKSMHTSTIQIRKWLYHKIYIAMYGYMSAIPASRKTFDNDFKEYFSPKHLSIGIFAGSNGSGLLKHYSITSLKTNFPYFEGNAGVMGIRLGKKMRRHQELKIVKEEPIAEEVQRISIELQKRVFEKTNHWLGRDYSEGRMIYEMCSAISKNETSGNKMEDVYYELGVILDKYQPLPSSVKGSFNRKVTNFNLIAKSFGQAIYEKEIKINGLYELYKTEVANAKKFTFREYEGSYKLKSAGHTTNTGGLIYGGLVTGSEFNELVKERGSAKRVWENALAGPYMIISDRCYDKNTHKYFEEKSGKKLIKVDITPALLMELSRFTTEHNNPLIVHSKASKDQYLNKELNRIVFSNPERYIVNNKKVQVPDVSKFLKPTRREFDINRYPKNTYEVMFKNPLRLSGNHVTENSIGSYESHRKIVLTDKSTDMVSRRMTEGGIFAPAPWIVYTMHDGTKIQIAKQKSNDRLSFAPEQQLRSFKDTDLGGRQGGQYDEWKERRVLLRDYVRKLQRAQELDRKLYPQATLLPGVSIDAFDPKKFGEPNNLIQPYKYWKLYYDAEYWVLIDKRFKKKSTWVRSLNMHEYLQFPEDLDMGYLNVLYKLRALCWRENFMARYQMKKGYQVFKWEKESYEMFTKEMIKIYPPFAFNPHLFNAIYDYIFDDISRVMRSIHYDEVTHWTGRNNQVKEGYNRFGYNYYTQGYLNIIPKIYDVSTKYNDTKTRHIRATFTSYGRIASYDYNYATYNSRLRKKLHKDKTLFDDYEYVTSTGLITGYPDNKFRPEYRKPMVNFNFDMLSHIITRSGIPSGQITGDIFLKVDISSLENISTQYIYYGDLPDEDPAYKKYRRTIMPYNNVELATKIYNKE